MSLRVGFVRSRTTRPRRRVLPGLLAGALTVGLAVAGDLASPTAVSAEADVNLVPIVPARLVDTRVAPNLSTIDGEYLGDGPVGTEQFIAVDVAGRGGVDANAEAVMLNVTAVGPIAAGYLTLWPCDAPQRPVASNVNYFAGDVAPNSVLAKLSADGRVCVFSKAASDVVVDVTGYVPAGGAPVTVVPARLLETRGGPGHVTVDSDYQDVGRVAAGTEVAFKATGRAGVPGNTEAVYLNVTAILPDGAGFLTVYPCGTERPGTSNVNYGPGQITPNAVLATVGANGMVCIYSKAAVDVIADVNGYLPPGGNRVAIQPARCADTRPEGETFDGLFEGDGKIAPLGTYAVTIAGRCGIPAGAAAAYLNVTAFDPDDFGYLTVWPCDEQRPTTSNVNYSPGQTRPNAVLSKISLDAGGQICIFSRASSHVIVDVNGYVPTPGLYGIEQVASGWNHTCVLLGDGSVRCTGLNGYLGDGTKGEDYPLPGGTFNPTLVTGLGSVEFIEAGEEQTCAVHTDRTARCWGRNNNGQLGDGTDLGDNGDSFRRRLSPVAVQGLTGIVDLSIWENHACAIVDSGTDGHGDEVWCWGDNGSGQLGNPGSDSFVPVQVPGLPGGRVPVQIEAGNNFSCVRLDDGTVWCWGHGGAIGRTHNQGSGAQAAMAVTGLTDVVDLSAGRNHTCVARGDGTVQCWGLNEDGALGPRNGAIDDRLPAQVQGVTGAVDVEAGYGSSCSRRADGTASCWGDNEYGQLGDGSPATSELTPVPVQAGAGRTIAALSNNGAHSCALRDDASVVCWGYYLHGNLGVAIPGHTATPVLFGSGDLRP